MARPEHSLRGSLSLGESRLDYTLVRVSRRRHVHLVVDQLGSLQVRGPSGLTRSRAEEAIRANQGWVFAALERAGRAERALRAGTLLPLVDERLRLCLHPGGGRRVERVGGDLCVYGLEAKGPDLRERLESWYRRQARSYLSGRLEDLARLVGVQPTAMSIRAQRTRWGSCSAGGHISLNWRLMLLPSELVTYVLVHELCHLRELNHSPRFWREVERHEPRWRESRRRLRAEHAALPL